MRYTDNPARNSSPESQGRKSSSSRSRKVHPASRTARKARAIAQILKYAGDHGHEASKTRWMQDLIMSIDADYYAQLEALKEQAAALSQQLETDSEDYESRLAGASAKISHLEERLAHSGRSAEDAAAQAAHSEDEMQRIREALEVAERAAAAASEECAHLQRCLVSVTEEDAKNRKQLSLRAYLLRETLLSAKHELRDHRHTVKQQHVTIGRLASDRETSVDRQVGRYEQLRDLATGYKQQQVMLQHEVQRLQAKMGQLRQMAGMRSAKSSRAGRDAGESPPGGGGLEDADCPDLETARLALEADLAVLAQRATTAAASDDYIAQQYSQRACLTQT